MSHRVRAKASEFDMPKLALNLYHAIVETNASPELFVYDRGGWSKDNVKMSKTEGVEKLGIQPRGKSRWRVSGHDKHLVLQQRSRIEGKIGTLKMDFGMDKPRKKLRRTVSATMPRSIAAYNPNRLMKDVVMVEVRRGA